jgi:hypothetical protein
MNPPGKKMRLRSTRLCRFQAFQDRTADTIQGRLSARKIALSGASPAQSAP